MKRTALLLMSLSTLANAQWSNLWPETAPGARQPPSGTETVRDHGIIADIEIPQYQIFLPDKAKATGAVAVIFPGGGYGVLAADHEGSGYAKWLNDRGIAGLVVKYRVSGNPALGYQFPVPFLDARRAIRLARSKAAEWNLDPKKVGVMGSSAGGHLASLCATRFTDTFDEEETDEIDKQECHPDFAILIYPVVSMVAPLGHGGSVRNLLGESPSPGAAEKMSTANVVTKDTPPTFILTTFDDPVDCRNSLEFATACKANGVPVALHLFEKGGHGYGLDGKGDVSVWPSVLEQWLGTRFPAKN